ncbi:hypothetical protein [Scleromatobacter humisilvae]|uniref:Uncharacterized protein n=1 Tax=Scleromatobacter humisilvae TaxID=2897159 RepID=A0A9X1YNE1_9BURK|nr:hypothetical protein [Scleromatobacter humisilvae]MCK9689393.1 hypothetical protein [Scleromatobacter humisilvae]
MLTKDSPPLALASKVLKIETLRAVATQPFNRFGWSVLDRWAFNSPAALQALEAQGLDAFRARVLDQQEREVAILLELSPSVGNSVPDSEVLAYAEVQTELA